jgi:hypothetical protein
VLHDLIGRPAGRWEAYVTGIDASAASAVM